MKLGKVTKQPAERFSYTINYSDSLTEGDNVESVIAAVDPNVVGGLLVDNVSPIDPRIRFWAGSGVDGVSYKVTLTVTTADGRVFQDEIIFRIKEI